MSIPIQWVEGAERLIEFEPAVLFVISAPG